MLEPPHHFRGFGFGKPRSTAIRVIRLLIPRWHSKRASVHESAPSIRYGVDGKANEGRARLGAIGGDHLGQVGHQLGRDYQLRNHVAEPLRAVPVAYSEYQASA